MLIKNIHKKHENSEKNKNMIRGIHYFSTELKTKIDVIPRSCFNSSYDLIKSLLFRMKSVSKHQDELLSGLKTYNYEQFSPLVVGRVSETQLQVGGHFPLSSLN